MTVLCVERIVGQTIKFFVLSRSFRETNLKPTHSKNTGQSNGAPIRVAQRGNTLICLHNTLQILAEIMDYTLCTPVYAPSPSASLLDRFYSIQSLHTFMLSTTKQHKTTLYIDTFCQSSLSYNLRMRMLSVCWSSMFLYRIISMVTLIIF